jgi:hypothetical protein
MWPILLSVICALLVQAVSVKGYVQDNALFVSGKALRLGMPKELVLPYYEKRYIVRKAKEVSGDIWTVSEKKGDLYNLVAVLSFKDDKLTGITKSWGDFASSEVVEAFMSLFSVLSDLTENERSNATITTKAVRDPRSFFNTIEILVGKRCVTVAISERGLFGKSVTISELLSEGSQM